MSACAMMYASTGDKITLIFPKNLYIDYAKDEPHFGSVMYGPLVLAGGLGKENMPDDRVSDNRTFREAIPAKDIPMLLGSLTDLNSWIKCSSQSPLHFTVKNGGGQRDIDLIPYFQMHHQRHTVYWKIYDPDEFAYRTASLTDVVKIGDEKDERNHGLQGENDSIYWHDHFWAKNAQYRMAKNGWFSYVLHIDKKETKPYYLIGRFWGDESDENQFDILIDDQYLCTVRLNRRLYLTYVDDVFPIPVAWTRGKNHVKVTFRAGQGKKAGGLYELKITSDTNYR